LIWPRLMFRATMRFLLKWYNSEEEMYSKVSFHTVDTFLRKPCKSKSCEKINDSYVHFVICSATLKNRPKRVIQLHSVKLKQNNSYLLQENEFSSQFESNPYAPKNKKLGNRSPATHR